MRCKRRNDNRPQKSTIRWWCYKPQPVDRLNKQQVDIRKIQYPRQRVRVKMQFWMPLRLCVHYVMKSVISFCLKMKWKQLSLQFLKNTVWAKALWNELRCHEFQPKHSSKEKPVKMWLNMLHRRLSPKNEGPKRLDRRVQTGDVLGNLFP